MKEIFKTLISDFVNAELPDMVNREIRLPVEPSLIVSLVGARRTGKTFLMFSLIGHLRKSMPANRLIYINLEDDRLWQTDPIDLAQFRDAYYELYPQNIDEQVYFCFDEVQEVSGWQRFVRRLVDTEKCYVYLTGSSSSLMSRDISTILRGKTLSIEVFPFNFREYLSLRRIAEDSISTKGKTLIKSAFYDFLSGTSMPAIITLEPYFRQRALQDYLDLIMFKDVAERFRVDNYILLKRLLFFLIANSANLISTNKIYADFSSQGLNLSKNTLYQYIGYLESAGILQLLPIYNSNLRVQSRNPYKVIVIDHGLKNLVSMQTDRGRNLETIVYWQLRRKYAQIYYWKNGQETDFVWQSSRGTELLNVCIDATNPSTLKRELDSLTIAMQKFGTAQAKLITMDKDAVAENKSGKINLISFWKWCLSGDQNQEKWR
jgi:predicted AAA+ superfamily ATPase